MLSVSDCRDEYSKDIFKIGITSKGDEKKLGLVF